MSNPDLFTSCQPHLSQGDIFRIKLLAPFADPEIRIFRSRSGKHGSLVLDGKEEGLVFSLEDLIDRLEDVPSHQTLLPFHRSVDGQDEMVVVYADLLEYFIIVSQTCDVSGLDHDPKPFACILPFVPLSQYLMHERLPILSDAESAWTTICDYLETTCNVTFGEKRDDPITLAEEVRRVLGEWTPKKGTEEKKIKGRIIDSINKAVDNKKNYLYYLPVSPELKVPEGYIDFLRMYTLQIEILNDLKESRVATVASPYREDLAQNLAIYLSRIALPKALSPPSI